MASYNIGNLQRKTICGGCGIKGKMVAVDIVNDPGYVCPRLQRKVQRRSDSVLYRDYFNIFLLQHERRPAAPGSSWQFLAKVR